MKYSIEDLRAEAERFLQQGEHLSALRVLVVLLQHSPDDLEVRLRLADTLSELGAKAEAAQVYEATADLSIEGGGPLVAVVACRALQRLGVARGADQRLDRLAEVYGRGSPRLGSSELGRVGARLNSAEAQRGKRVAARELQRGRTVRQLVDEALAVGGRLDEINELPSRLVARDPVLSTVSPDALRRALRAVAVRRVPAGQILFCEGERGTSCYLLASGRVRISCQSDLGRDQELTRLGPGAVFGEIALVTGSPRGATAQTLEPSDLIEIGPTALSALGDELAEVAPALLKLAHTRLMRRVLRSSLLRLFTPEQQQLLLRRFAAQDVPAGTVLFEQGEAPRGIYLVLQGEVVITQRVEGRRTYASCRHSGALIGVRSTLGDQPARGAAVTSTRATLLFLSRRIVDQLTESVPEVVEAMGAIACHRDAMTDDAAAADDARAAN